MSANRNVSPSLINYLSCTLTMHLNSSRVVFQDVVSVLLAAGCPDLGPGAGGGTLPRRRGSGQAGHGRSKEIASSVL